MLSDAEAVDPRFRLETERLHALVSNIPLGVLVEDENRHVAMVNDAFCTVFGIAAGDIVGTDCALAAVAVAPLMTEPDRYVSLLTDRIERGVSAVADEVSFLDGRVLERDYVPIIVDATRRGHLWLFRDVTESRRLVDLERAAAVRDELRVVIDTIPGLVWSALPGGRVETFNARWREYTGLALEAGGGWGWDAIIHPEDLAAFQLCFSTGLATSHPAETEARLRRADGQYRWFLFRAVPLLGKDRLPKQWYGQATDIDDGKRAALMVSAEKQLLESIATGASLAAVLDALCRHVELLVGDAFASVLLVDRDTRRIRHGASPSLPASFADLVDGLLCEAEGGPCAEAVLTRAPVTRRYDGAPPPPHMREAVEQRGVLSTFSLPFFSAQGEPLGTLALHGPRDAAATWGRHDALGRFAHFATVAVERELALRAVSRSERLLREAQTLSQTGSFSWNPRTGYLVWSEQVYRIYGLDPALPLELESARARVHPEDVELFSTIAGRSRTRLEPLSFGHRIVRDGGEVRHVEVVMRPMSLDAPPGNDASWEYLGAVHDVTDRKIAEARLQQMQDELSHVTRVSTLGELTASIAHELNQPLTAIVVGASTSTRLLEASPPRIEEALEAAQRIRRDGKRAGDVIARLRALFQKNDRGSKEAVDVNQAVQEVLVLTRNELHKGRVALTVELDPALPLALGHRVQVQQVTLNLIVNAGEALDGVEGRARSIAVRTALVGTEIHVRVRDNGRGIAPGDAERVFGAFFTRKPSGMGMGLAVSRTIVEAHGGRLWVEENEGDGVTFAFSLLPHG